MEVFYSSRKRVERVSAWSAPIPSSRPFSSDCIPFEKCWTACCQLLSITNHSLVRKNFVAQVASRFGLMSSKCSIEMDGIASSVHNGSNNEKPARTSMEKEITPHQSMPHENGRTQSPTSHLGQYTHPFTNFCLHKIMRRWLNWAGRGFRSQVRLFTWGWFTMNMATGGLAVALNSGTELPIWDPVPLIDFLCYSVPFRFRGLTTIGKILFLLDLVLYLINGVIISIRFLTDRESFENSFLNPKESLYIPASTISLAILFVNLAQYGIPNSGIWLQSTLQVVFWVYSTLAFISACGIYLIL